MKKTYITTLPDRAEAFLEVTRIVSDIGANLTRVSYSKAVDAQTLFIDAEGTPAQLEQIAEQLSARGYCQNPDAQGHVVLLGFVLKNELEALAPVLELIARYTFTISYINAQAGGTGAQDCRIGLFVKDQAELSRFMQEAATLCPVRVVEYNRTERILDNTAFYTSFAGSVAEKLGLGLPEKRALMTASNRIMQRLDELNLPAHRTFDVIGKIVDMIAAYSGDKFEPRITHTPLKNDVVLHLIEPPVGSDTWILEKGNELLFIDTGFACYAEEMLKIFHDMFPDFDDREKRCAITHPDMDHCGLLPLFDIVYVSRRAWEHFRLENEGEPNFREQVPAHAPYCRIAKIASNYAPPAMETLHVIESNIDAEDLPIFPIGQIEFCGLRLTVYRGNGGHAEGEVVIVDEADKLVFCGDILVNPRGFTKPQDAYNRLAPYLLSSVNVDSARARIERNYMMVLFQPEEYAYACGHGALLKPGESSR